MKNRKLLLLPLLALVLAGCKPSSSSLPSVSDEEPLPSVPSSVTPTVETVSIEDAREDVGANVIVDGVITSIFGMANNTLSITVQEEAHALTAVFVEPAAAANLKVGDYVRVKGKIDEYNGLIQLKSPIFEKLPGDAPVITPFVITEWSRAALLGMDARIAKISGLKHVRTEDVSGNTRYVMKYGDVELPMLLSQYLDAADGAAIKAKMAGLKSVDTINFEGPLGWFDDKNDATAGPQLNPVNPATITVVEGEDTGEPVDLTALAFNEKATKLAPEETLQLTLLKTPNDGDITGLVYASSAPAVATVSETGLVTAVADGVANITATVGDIVATIAITVVTPNPNKVVDFDLTIPDTWVSDDKPEGSYFGYATTYNVVIKDGAIEIGWLFRGSNPNNMPDEGVRFGSKQENAKLDTIIEAGLPMDAAKAATLSAVFAQSKDKVVGSVKEVVVEIDGLFGSGVTRDKIYLQASVDADFTAPINLGELAANDGLIKFQLDDAYVDHYYRIIFGLVNTGGNAGYKVKQIAFFSAHSAAPVEPEPTAPTALVFDERDSELEIGETLQLTLVPTPNTADLDGLVYASSAEGVASVSETGLVTAIAEGSTNITATVGDVVATIKITVVAPDLEPHYEFSFANKDLRVSIDDNSAVFVNEDATITQLKGDSTTNIGDYINPLRVYKNHHLKFELADGKLITKIILQMNSTSYATAFSKGTVEGATISLDGSTITMTLDAPAAELLFKNVDSQARINSLKVYYE